MNFLPDRIVARLEAARRGSRLFDARVDRGIPVKPGGWPVVGQLPEMVRDMPGLIRRGARDHGPVFWVDMGFGKRFVVCAHPSAFDLLKSKQVSSASYVEIAGTFLGHHSLIVQDGAEHRHTRSALNPPFTPKGLSAAEIGGVFADVVEQHVARWVELPEVTLLEKTRELALAVIFRMMGVSDDMVPKWRKQYEEFLLSALDIPIDLPGSPMWRANRAKRWLNEHLMVLVNEARSRPEEPGLLSQLAYARDQDGQPLAEAELLDNLRLLVLAGHETTASLLVWMVVHLAHEPSLWAKVRDEARVAPVPRTPKELRQFPIAEAVFRETLRLHPSVSIIQRRVVEPLELCGLTVPAGVDVIIPLSFLARDGAQYPEPDAFRPERWLGRSSPPTPYETAPFGGGAHFCLGYHAATMEGVQLLVALTRALGRAGRRPSLVGRWPSERAFPLGRPDPKTRVAWRHDPAAASS